MSCEKTTIVCASSQSCLLKYITYNIHVMCITSAHTHTHTHIYIYIFTALYHWNFEMYTLLTNSNDTCLMTSYCPLPILSEDIKMESIRLCAPLDTLPAKKCLHPFETQNLMFATSIYWTGSMLTFL